MPHKILVTGAAGFIPSHIVDVLLSQGHQVLGVDNLSTGNLKNIAKAQNQPNFTFIEASVTNPPQTYLPNGYVPDWVFHLASPASPIHYQADPLNTYQVNAFGCHNLLTYLKDNAPQARFLFASTSEVYGDPQVHPQPESYWGNVNPNGIRSCYDESKRFGETICGIFHRQFKMDIRLIRIFNTYGPRMDLYDGRIIPNFVVQALKNEPYTIYGDGSQTRSYCYVDDLVTGILTFMADPHLAGETINLGNEGEYTVKETAQIIHTAFYGNVSHPQFTNLPLPGDDPTRRQPDISKAKKLLSWQPKIAFEEGILRTIEDFKQRYKS